MNYLHLSSCSQRQCWTVRRAQPLTKSKSRTCRTNPKHCVVLTVRKIRVVASRCHVNALQSHNSYQHQDQSVTTEAATTTAKRTSIRRSVVSAIRRAPGETQLLSRFLHAATRPSLEQTLGSGVSRLARARRDRVSCRHYLHPNLRLGFARASSSSFYCCQSRHPLPLPSCFRRPPSQ